MSLYFQWQVNFTQVNFFLKVLKVSFLFVQWLRGNVTLPAFFPSILHTRHNASLDCCLGSLTTNCYWILENIKQMEHTTNNVFCQLVNQLKTSMTQPGFLGKRCTEGIKTYYLTEHIMVEVRKPEVTSPDCCSAQVIVTERDTMCS